MRSRRPTSITILCVLMTLGALLTLPALLLWGGDLPGWFPPFVLLGASVGLVSMVGLWRMKQWAVYLYAAMALLGQVVMVVAGTWTPLSLAVPAIVIAILVSNLGEMD